MRLRKGGKRTKWRQFSLCLWGFNFGTYWCISESVMNWNIKDIDKKNYVKDVYKSFNSFAITLSITTQIWDCTQCHIACWDKILVDPHGYSHQWQLVSWWQHSSKNHLSFVHPCKPRQVHNGWHRTNTQLCNYWMPCWKNEWLLSTFALCLKD